PPLSRPAPRTSPAPPLPRRDALPISDPGRVPLGTWVKLPATESMELVALAGFDFAVIDLEHSAMNLETAFRHIGTALLTGVSPIDRKSTRLNSSHVKISYAVFCLKKK